MFIGQRLEDVPVVVFARVLHKHDLHFFVDHKLEQHTSPMHYVFEVRHAWGALMKERFGEVLPCVVGGKLANGLYVSHALWVLDVHRIYN